MHIINGIWLPGRSQTLDIAKTLATLSYAYLCPGKKTMIGYLDLTGLVTVNSESLNIIINFRSGGRAKCLSVADMGLCHEMRFRPRFSYDRLYIRFPRAIPSVGTTEIQGYQDRELQIWEPKRTDPRQVRDKYG